jgi:hypothetical protein
MGALNLLPLGEPSRFDIESAAKLYLEYESRGLLSEDVAESFAMMVDDFEAVYARAVELKKQPAAGA